jgi:hypothetical protein
MDGNTGEGNDPTLVIEPLVSSAPAMTPSGLEEGRIRDKASMAFNPNTKTSGDFDLECIDISRDGGNKALDGPFHEGHLDELKNSTPSGVVRLIVAQQMRTQETASLPLSYEAKLFRKSVDYPNFGPDGYAFEFQQRLWGEHDVHLFRQFLQFRCNYRFCAFDDFFELWGLEKEDSSALASKVSYLWLNQLPDSLIGIAPTFLIGVLG